MRSKIAKIAFAVGASAMIAASSYVPAQAGGRDVAAGVIGGLLLGGIIASQRPYYANPPGPYYAPPAAYVAPRVCWRKEKYYDPYAGWGWRRVQYYC